MQSVDRSEWISFYVFGVPVLSLDLIICHILHKIAWNKHFSAYEDEFMKQTSYVCLFLFCLLRQTQLGPLQSHHVQSF